MFLIEDHNGIKRRTFKLSREVSLAKYRIVGPLQKQAGSKGGF